MNDPSVLRLWREETDGGSLMQEPTSSGSLHSTAMMLQDRLLLIIDLEVWHELKLNVWDERGFTFISEYADIDPREGSISMFKLIWKKKLHL